MARERICGVYKIISPSCGFYIGSSRDISKRLNEHIAAIKRGTHCNRKLQNAANKHGIDRFSFEIIKRCNHGDVRDFEQKYINELVPKYNLSRHVEKPLTELWESQEFRKRNSEKATIQNKIWWNTPGNKEKASGRVIAMHTPEVKARAKEGRLRSFAMKGDIYNRAVATGSRVFKELHQDPEFSKAHAERMRNAMLEKCKDKGFCNRRDEAAAKANRKPIMLINTGIVFPSKKEAAEIMGISVSLITKQLQGKPTKTNYKWEFLAHG